MDDQVLEQADITPVVDSGDVPTDEESGHIHTSIPMVPDDSAKKSDRNAEAKKERISQEEWQKRTEAAKEGEQIKEQLAETLEIKPEDPKDLGKLALEQIAELKRENARKEWELAHPIVRSEKYSEEWNRVNKEKKYAELTYDERWALVNRERPSSLNRELNDQAQMKKASVPLTSRGSAPTKALDPETARIAQIGGFTEDDFKQAGLL